ncbi:MAG: hypothetical protein ACRDLV_12325 [Solirubrobacteraceae bacterium]
MDAQPDVREAAFIAYSPGQEDSQMMISAAQLLIRVRTWALVAGLTAASVLPRSMAGTWIG